MKNLEILKTGQVRINKELADFDALNDNFKLVETIETESGDLDVFETKGGYIEYLGDSSFIHGESANFTTCSIEEIKEHYKG